MTVMEIKNILGNNDPLFLENLARKSAEITTQFFGRTISLYAPIYLSNYCSSCCTYCGFNSRNKIKRLKLKPEEMHREMAQVAESGIENILLLTGESYQATPLAYLKEAVQIAKQYFTGISLEVHPMEENEYAQLYKEGADGITIYQETYNRPRYKEVHLSGKKSDFDFRYNAPERIAKSGIRQISLGILLGLYDAAADLYSLYQHLRWLERFFPGVEYSLSFPRLRKIKGTGLPFGQINDATFIKIICLTRILFPQVGINLSTRETPFIRDHAIGLGVTRISAGSNTSVGGYTVNLQQKQDPQFDIEDNRSLKEVIAMLKGKNFDPVLTDWRPIQNGQ